MNTYMICGRWPFDGFCIGFVCRVVNVSVSSSSFSLVFWWKAKSNRFWIHKSIYLRSEWFSRWQKSLRYCIKTWFLSFSIWFLYFLFNNSSFIVKIRRLSFRFDRWWQWTFIFTWKSTTKTRILLFLSFVFCFTYPKQNFLSLVLLWQSVV